jgi:hypothetical protein
LLFGEEHANDHPDHLEVELTSVGFPGQYLDPDGDTAPALIGPDRLDPTSSAGWLSVRIPRGPPVLHPARPAFFTPAPRGPPMNSLA